MTLVVEDAEVDELAERLMAMRQVDKTEAVRQALRNEVALVEAKASRVTKARDFDERLAAVKELQERLVKMGDPSKGLPADKDFIDSLYE